MLAVVAMPEEIELIKDRNLRCNCIVTGPGALNVIRALKGIDRNECIYNVGYVGSNSIRKGETVRIGEVRLYHPNVTIDEPRYMLDGDTLCYTSNDFVLSTNVERPCVFDMELAFILAMGFNNVIAEKVVSDQLNLCEFNEVVYGTTEN